jgi:hypothetical protein
VCLHPFAASTLDEGESSVSRPGRFTAEERPPLHPFNRRLGGPQNLSACRKEKKYLSLLPEMGEKRGVFRIYMENYTKLKGGYTRYYCQ